MRFAQRRTGQQGHTERFRDAGGGRRHMKGHKGTQAMELGHGVREKGGED